MSNPRDIFTESDDFPTEQNAWLRLRTLILLRWTAIFGQLAALAVVTQYFGIQVPLGLCFFAIGLAIIANLLAIFIFPENKRLSEGEAKLTLVFDLAQLGFLLFLTGGLTNPFALLMLAPVIVSATALRLRSTILLGILAASIVTLIGLVNLPLRYETGGNLAVPELFVFGFWIAILIGIGFLSLYSRRISSEMRSMSDALLATQMALAREQKLTDLGGVIAAAAHELGTPLATIKLVSTELIAELSDHPDLAEDVLLIREQADRCRDILRSMGKAGKDDLHMRQGLLSAVLREAAEPHLDRGKTVRITVTAAPQCSLREPDILRRPELIHGLRNLVQNAVDFAHGKVWIDASYSETRLRILIVDDGPGYPLQVIGRIGDPFVRPRRDQRDLSRPGYEGMGLGLFIAKTLLERTGAELSFANGSDPFLQPEERPERKGAIVEVVWQDALIFHEARGGLGLNPVIDT